MVVLERVTDFFLGLNAGQWLKIRVAQISDGATAALQQQLESRADAVGALCAGVVASEVLEGTDPGGDVWLAEVHPPGHANAGAPAHAPPRSLRGGPKPPPPRRPFPVLLLICTGPAAHGAPPTALLLLGV